MGLRCFMVWECVYNLAQPGNERKVLRSLGNERKVLRSLGNEHKVSNSLEMSVQSHTVWE